MAWRAALIGCGNIGSAFADDSRASAFGVCTHAAAYSACRHTDLVAVCDTDPERARHCARRWGAAACYADPARLLAEARPEIVSVCTPDVSHYDVVGEVLRADGVRAVLAEKPLATTLAQAEELARLARERGVTLAVNYGRRYSESHARLRDFLRGGGLGEVRLVRGLYGKGTAHNGTHWFDLVRFFLGEVTTVRGRDRLNEGGGDPTLDVSLDLVGGATAVLHACPAPEFTVFETDLLGSGGRARVIDSGEVTELYGVVDGVPFAGYRGLTLTGRTQSGLRDLLLTAVEDLVASLERGTAPRCSAADGV